MIQIGATHPREHKDSKATSVSNKILQAIPEVEYRLLRSHLEPCGSDDSGLGF